jgi:hypothetical protein
VGDYGVEARVEVVEQIDDLEGSADSRQLCESDDVAKVDRDTVEAFCLDAIASLQSFSNRPANDFTNSPPLSLRLTLGAFCAATRQFSSSLP